MVKKSEYNAKDISVLKGLDPVRKRPGMFIGSTDTEGLHHLVFECVSNALDEAMAGYAKDIEVILWDESKMQVTDNGRGIPIDKHKETGKSALETVMTTLHAGGKFGNKVYQVSGGLHGVGVSVVCALSEWMRAEVYRGGDEYSQEYKKGKAITKLKKEGKTKKTGTSIIFQPDPEIFREKEFNAKKIENYLRQQAYLTKGVKIKFIDKRGDTERKKSFYFEGGISSYIKHLIRGIEPVQQSVFYCSGEEEGVIVEAAFLYTQEYEIYEESFANNINTKEGGAHLTGFRSALTKTINNYARREGYLKENDDNLKGDDVREGLTGVVSVKLKDPQFEGQTKAKLGNVEARSAVETLVSERLVDFFERNPQDARVIISKCVLSAKARRAAKAVRETVLRKGALDGLSLPGKLSDCITRKPEESELYIVEGESAGGSCKGARDRRFQAILPLKGKILNVERYRLNKILESKEIKALVIALGTAIAEDFDIEKLRYHRIILMADADSVTGDTPVLLFDKEKEEFFLTEIGEFVENCDDTTKYQVLTYNPQNKKKELKEIYQTIKHPLRTSLYKIKSYCGYPIKVTDCHSVYVYENGKITTKKGSEVKVGDYLVFPKSLPHNGKDTYIDLTETILNCNNHKRKINRRFKLDKELAFFIGFYIGDGYFASQKKNPNRFSFALNKKDSENYLKDLSRIIEKKWKAKPILEERPETNSIVLTFHSFEFRLLLQKLGLLNKKVPEKFIPRIFFNAKKEIQESLLRGLLQSDGFITVWKGKRPFSSKAIYGWRLSSEKAILGILTIFRQWGMFPALSVNKSKDHQRKDGKTIRSNFNSYDLNISTVRYLTETRNIWQSHKDAYKLEEYLKQVNHKKVIGKYIQPISSDFVGLKVREVEEIKNPEDKFVYDLSVMGNQNFVAGAGGNLAHNSDGNHIKTLLLTLFFRYFKPLIEKGHLYIAKPPLYKIQSGKRMEYAYMEGDKAEILEDMKGASVDVQRYKGLGEMNPEQLWETTMNPENRILMQVTIEDAKEADRIFDALMGREVALRRNFIKTHAKETKNLDV